MTRFAFAALLLAGLATSADAGWFDGGYAAAGYDGQVIYEGQGGGYGDCGCNSGCGGCNDHWGGYCASKCGKKCRKSHGCRKSRCGKSDCCPADCCESSCCEQKCCETECCDPCKRKGCLHNLFAKCRKPKCDSCNSCGCNSCGCSSGGGGGEVIHDGGYEPVPGEVAPPAPMEENSARRGILPRMFPAAFRVN